VIVRNTAPRIRIRISRGWHAHRLRQIPRELSERFHGGLPRILGILRITPDRGSLRGLGTVDIHVESSESYNMVVVRCRPGQALEVQEADEGAVDLHCKLTAEDAGTVLVLLGSTSGTAGMDPGPSGGMGLPSLEALPPSMVTEEPQKVEAHADASMPPACQVGEPTELVVRFSLGNLATGTDRTGVGEDVALDPKQPVEIKLRRENLHVAPGTSDRLEVPLPSGSDTVEKTFTVVGREPGPAWAELVFTQDSPVPLAIIKIKSEVVADEVPMAQAKQQHAVLSPLNPELTSFPVLSVDEDFIGDRWVLEYDLGLRNHTRERFTMECSVPKAELLDWLYSGVDELWTETETLDPIERSSEFEKGLALLGRELAVLVAPSKLLERLNATWDQLSNLALLSSEIELPWELMQISPLGAPSRFLGETGLVRWCYDVMPPGALRARPGHVLYLCPEYPAPLSLPQAAAEAEFLTTLLSASALDPEDAAALADLLRQKKFDLFHFGGHGEYGPDGQFLLFASQDPAQRGYPASALAQDFHASSSPSEGEGGPIIVLNACSQARSPRTGTEAFALGFLAGGAGAFIGCLWSVGDRPARIFSEAFYSTLHKGQPIAAAVCAGRKAARSAGDASWLAYAAYAHPLATVNFDLPSPLP
jgi:hypothetical protein